MAFQPAPNCAEAVIHGSISGRSMANVLNFSRAGGYEAEDLCTLAGVIANWWSTEVLPELSVGYSFESVLVRGLAAENDQTCSDNTGAGPGSVSGPGLSANAALVVTHRSGFTGRSARGRTYVGGIPASVAVSTLAVTGTFRTAIEEAFLEIPNYAAVEGWTHVVLSRYSNGAPRETAVTFAVIDYEVRNVNIDSMRTRLAVGH